MTLDEQIEEIESQINIGKSAGYYMDFEIEILDSLKEFKKEKLTNFSLIAIMNLTKYLYAHENDIANDINDYGELKIIFNQLYGRDPKK